MPRVGLTSTSDSLPRLSEIVSKHGLDPVRLPCIEVTPADDDSLAIARTEADGADWIVITSRRAVGAVWPRGGMPEVPVAAVGQTTAAAVHEAGGSAALVGEGGAAELIRRLGSEVSGKRVLFPHAAGADPSTVESLETAGAEVIALVVYETRPVAPEEDPVDSVMFGSPSAVAGWCLSRPLEGITLAAIGETTRAALIDRGYEPDVTPPRPDFELLAAMLADHLRERSSV
jgi:uroporphyrinogen-III synthase